MSFLDFAKSRFKGKPTSLIAFEYGVGLALRYTTARDIVTFDGHDYEPVAISYDAIKSTGTGDNETKTITVAQDNEAASLFAVTPPSTPVIATIYQGYLGDPDNDFRALWIGRVTGVQWRESDALISVAPIAQNKNQPGLRRHYQRMCPHVLYGKGCGASKTAATSTHGVAGVSGSTVTLSTTIQSNPERYAGGTMEWSVQGQTQIGSIVSATNTTVELSAPPQYLNGGDSVDLVLGCAHTIDACRDWHNNLANFGGQPLIPIDDPTKKNNFY